MREVVVGVLLTALLGGLLVPAVKELLDRRSERHRVSVELVDTLASSLWMYWKLALRVAYYGRKPQRGSDDLDQALRRWDNDESWQTGCEIQIQVSRSKRLLPPTAHADLDQAQKVVVDFLDDAIERLRQSDKPAEWEAFYAALMTDTRAEIDRLLTGVTRQLDINGPPWPLRTRAARPVR